MKTRTVYEAFDGATFDTAEACKAHESAHVETRLVGLTIEQVRAALSREDIDLADVIEELGARINKIRRDAGDLRRGGRKTADPETQKAPDAEPTRPDPMAEALRRAQEAGLVAWNGRRGAVVPDAFASVKPLHDAWLKGWGEGQMEASASPTNEAA